ncbi:MAG: type II toxin-antitoxin system Phd/YefM family antitoxin [Stellaceae bacterium]
MDRRIDAHIARTQFGQIMDLATKNNERFIVDRHGEPAVVIMSVQDFIRTAAPPPDWLQKAWSGAKRRGSTLWRAPISTPKLARIGATRTPTLPAGRSDPGGYRHECAGFRPYLLPRATRR